MIITAINGALDSTPESDPIPQAEKGGRIMRCKSFQFSHLLYRVSRAMGSTLARICRLCCGIKFSGIGISLIPGIITCNISFRAGGGRVQYTISTYLKMNKLCTTSQSRRRGLAACLLAKAVAPAPYFYRWARHDKNQITGYRRTAGTVGMDRL